ncbi:MAG TPA: hypothetical protein VLX92_25070 [Kofleriaceae bacterium]|nr:hypothetical protein [Kofleriaceae bacterium]
MKSDTPGYLTVKLTVITTGAAAWLEAMATLGELDLEEDVSGWAHRRIVTSARLADLAIRVDGYVGPPQADALVGLVGADRVVSDGLTEIPEVSLATVPRVVGPPGRETLLGALKDVLREAANRPG